MVLVCLLVLDRSSNVSFNFDEKLDWQTSINEKDLTKLLEGNRKSQLENRASFLDLIPNLNDGTFQAYKKPNDETST